MNLKACESCGVVVDLDVVDFVNPVYNHDGEILNTVDLGWNKYDYVPGYRCPACKCYVFSREG